MLKDTNVVVRFNSDVSISCGMLRKQQSANLLSRNCELQLADIVYYLRVCVIPGIVTLFVFIAFELATTPLSLEGYLTKFGYKLYAAMVY